MTEENTQQPDKVLIIRMLSTADAFAIGLPVVQLYQRRFPQAEIHFLTFEQGGQLIAKAAPQVKIHKVESQQWPDDFFLAMESFLGLAEHIIGQQYSQIINLDTAFMPCFLSRFLKDALEPVVGNYLSQSVQQLLDKVQDQSLQADYVNQASQYLSSTFSTIYKWHGSAWQMGNLPEGGYQEYYLRHCCGLEVKDLSLKLAITPDKRLAKIAKQQNVIGLCFSQSEDGYLYPYPNELKKALEGLGYYVWLDSDTNNDPLSLCKMLAASHLFVGKASGLKWYAQGVDCPSLIISGDSQAEVFMPDFATEPTPRCEQHGQANHGLSPALVCSCDKPIDLAESIQSIFDHFAQEHNHA
ncbi:glycosyltransferase family 9 protein [Paraglaciecola aestuariivivens]